MNSVSLETISRYWHTARHLKPGQMYRRAWFRMRKPAPRKPSSLTTRARVAEWQSPVPKRQSMTGSRTFTMLNRSGEVQGPADWQDDSNGDLWRYNLHYFDDLVAEDADSRRRWHEDLILRWIDDNSPGAGVGWDPYPTSIRIVNWVKWLMNVEAGRKAMLESLFTQADYLSRRLEWHLLGNHLFANAKALIFAGCYFSGRDADRIREKGVDLIDAQLKEQLLSDGGHIERSPMYHALILEDLLDLINLANTYGVTVSRGLDQQWRDAVRQMLAWLAAMSHPDGSISFFNDAAFGIAPELSDLERYADRIKLHKSASRSKRNAPLNESGYIRLDRGPAALIFDAAPVGPDYQPGHAHADTLSLELSLQRERIIVNSGTNCYGAGPARQFQRSTAAHSTVEVNGESSSEVWNGFRVARRAYPVGLEVTESSDAVNLVCAHTGYQRLKPRVNHRRSLSFSDTSLTVEDTLEGEFRTAIARYYLRPGLQAALDQGTHAGTIRSDQTEISFEVSGGNPSVESSFWYPRFGEKQANQCLVIYLSSPNCRVCFRW